MIFGQICRLGSVYFIFFVSGSGASVPYSSSYVAGVFAVGLI